MRKTSILYTKRRYKKSGYIVTAKKYGITLRTLKIWIKDYENMKA